MHALEKRIDDDEQNNDIGIDLNAATQQQQLKTPAETTIIQQKRSPNKDSARTKKTDRTPRFATAASANNTSYAHSSPKATIAYAVSITACNEQSITSGNVATSAAVLAESIRLNSFNASSSPYAYRMVAFVHPDAEECAPAMKSVGYDVYVRDTPVKLSDIQGDELRKKLPGSGCCGEKEYLKLYAYTLVDHPVVVHLDLDTLILKPMDDLFDAMLDGPGSPARDRLPAMPNFEHDALRIPDKIEAFFTRDWGKMYPGQKAYIQGGFFVIRPNLDHFELYRQIITKGDFSDKMGWGNMQYKTIYEKTKGKLRRIQGLVAYFYDHVRKDVSVDLDWCVYNNKLNNPYMDGECLHPFKPCVHCGKVDLSRVALAHFTRCAKPWKCKPNREDLCLQFHRQWFSILKSLDESLSRKKPAGGTYEPDHFLGYCKSRGENGFLPLSDTDIQLMSLGTRNFSSTFEKQFQVNRSIAPFLQEYVKETMKYQVGDPVDAIYDGKYHAAEVIGLDSELDKVTVKYDDDGSIATLKQEFVRRQIMKHQVGARVKARYDGHYYTAKVVGFDSELDKVLVKFDDDKSIGPVRPEFVKKLK